VLEINNADPKKGRAAAEKMLADAGLPINDENVFIAASCLEKGIAFLKDPAKAPNGVRKNAAEAAPAAGGAAGGKDFTVTVNGKAYGVSFGADGQATVNGQAYTYAVKDGIAAAAPAAAPAAGGGAGEPFKAPMPGLVLRLTAQNGAQVAADEEVLVMESMKMEMPMKAPKAGVVTINVAQGDKINTGDTLFTVA
jgi:pyruvate carboxylase subunit B